MDRRTLIFVISLSCTLLLVNTYFERGRLEERKEQIAQHKAKREIKREELKQDITERTASLNSLPVITLYSDKAQQQPITHGTLANNTILTLSWQDKLPNTVYHENTPYHLSFAPKELHQAVIYEKQKEDTLAIGDLPYFGHFDLQLVTFSPGQPDTPPYVTLGNYTDGHFSVPLQKLATINKELGIEDTEKGPLPGHAIALMNVDGNYLPAGIYHPDARAFTYLEQISDLRTEIVKPQQPTPAADVQEKYYVLENDTHQLVFTNRGGALIEINLPFETEDNPNSIVKQIDFDRDITKNHPYNAHFPANPYFTPGESPQGPYKENSKGKLGGYYPLLRRSLIQPSNKKSTPILPEFYGFNIISEYPEMAQQIFEVKSFDTNQITFESAQRNRRITKTYTLNKDDKNAPYVFDLTIKVEGDSRGLWLTTGIPEVEWISNASSPAMKYRLTRKGKSEIKNLDKPKDVTLISSEYPDWICNSNGFLGVIIDPLSEIDPGLRAQLIPGATAPTRLIQIDEEGERFKAQDLPGYMMMLPLSSKGGTMNFRVFAGPFATRTLKQVDKIYSDPTTGYNPNYIESQSFHGIFSFISAPFSKFLLILMQFFHTLTNSWGISIILLTVALRIMLYPLNAWSTKSMLKMQQITPQVQKIQEKYKKDPKKAQLEVMNLYRESGVNPVSGCFPILIQMPFLIGMFDLLKSTFELRGASFIPGWIDNLAAPDVLFSWTTPIIFIGTQFHLLPILLGAVMFLQQRMMSTLPKDPSQWTEQQRQQRAMGSMMAVVFCVMFYHFPSGLNIYWLSSMILGILQQMWTQKKMKQQPKTEILVPVKEKTRKGR